MKLIIAFFFGFAYCFANAQDDIIKLPEPKLKGSVSVEETMLNRRSVRDFKSDALSLEQVSQILWAAYGVTKEMNSPSTVRGGLKTAPSAGARYPLEIYVVVGNVNGLGKGIYRFLPEGHFLMKTYDQDIRKELAEAALDQEFIEQAPISLFYSAVYSRTTSKYRQRGRDRYVCMDLGHSAENVCLQVVAMGLATCPVGAFEDRMVRNVIMIPDKEEPLYIMPIGYPVKGSLFKSK
ncbi:MAG: SagB/ThcOx family dehydrogenase [Bacteroidales bacterium]|nr:SagB/ThcOx family dehydrogenase [Bacteroidales bacterium]